ncbi:hypothetical protein [Luteimonas sp. A649]
MTITPDQHALLLRRGAGNGLSAHTCEQPIPVMRLFVAMVGGRRLWAMYAMAVVALILGFAERAKMAENVEALPAAGTGGP